MRTSSTRNTVSSSSRAHGEDDGSTPTSVTAQTGSRLATLGGWALTAGPIVFLAGLLTSPAGDTTNTLSSIHSFTAHPDQSQASALLLHYGLILMALGLTGVPSLAARGRGSMPALLGSIGASIGMLNVSGALRDDFWRMAAGATLTDDQAVGVVEAAEHASLLGFWTFTEMIAFLGILVLLSGLARAHVLSWIWPGAAAAAFAATMAIPGDLEIWPSVAFGAFMATLIPVGLRVRDAARS